MKNTDTLAIAIGTGSYNSKNNLLECFYPSCLTISKKAIWDELKAITNVAESSGSTIITASVASKLRTFAQQTTESALAKLILQQLEHFYQIELLITFCDIETAPKTIADSYLRLHLLSHRVYKPQEINLKDIFSILPNVAWTNQGAIDPNELAEKQWQARIHKEHLHVYSVDKFPPMADYIVPSEVRIGNASRLRLGAYVGAGTTVMHEGFINFNAGTQGPNMVEGRISAGVFVEEGSDLGGGASTMGTLSGGGKEIISVGKNSLIGANAGLGIPLGDNCIIESGLYLTAASKVNVLDKDRELVDTVKAVSLSKKDNLLFRRNSMTGAIECLTNKTAVKLNEDLHKN